MGLQEKAGAGVNRPRRALAAAAAWLALTGAAAAQDTHLLLITGVSGDEEHAAQFHKWGVAIVDAARKAGVADANIAYLAERTEIDAARIRARATRENISRAIAETAKRAKAGDQVMIVLIGHGSYDGRQGAFNLPGPDLTIEDYSALLAQLALQRVAFVNTASSSGAFVPVLKGPNRAVVTATKTGGERNETRFPGFFVEALQAEAADRDRNGRVSLLEAFDFARAKVAADYEQQGHLLSEHAVLDDGAEGKLAATMFLAPRGAQAAAIASADPKLRALLEERDALERQVGELRLRRDTTDPAEYDRELEQLLTALALKSRAIRELEAKR
jgi:hypothetical protein